MRWEEISERHIQLSNILAELSLTLYSCENDEAKVRDFAEKLKNIFTDGYTYAENNMLKLVTDLYTEDSEDVECLVQNLQEVHTYIERDYEPKKGGEFKTLHTPLTNLIASLNLEMGHVQYYKMSQREIASLRENTLSLRMDLANAKSTLDLSTERASSMQTELVGVLSIFAAIVIAFSGGVSFLGNAISSIQNVIIYKSIIICLICGLILFNLVFLMLYIVGKIINRSIFAHCTGDCGTQSNKDTSNCQCIKQCTLTCDGLSRIRKRLPYVFWVNAVGLTFCVLDIIAWYLRLHNFFPFNF